MRPERLELEGFVAFRQATVVDFAGADLFALVGATGAGKSSLIDAMIFALYGSVPRYGDRRLVAPVINQQSVEARVAFTFSVTGQRYLAVRVVRAQTGGGATTKEARLERLGAQGEVEEVLAGDADGVTAAVEALLGLAYEHFTTCVVLPQGEFARFLHQKPRDRQALLIELLDLGIYTDMARRAGEHAAVAKERRTISEARRAELGEPSAQRITELHGLIDALGALVDGCSAAQDRLDVLATDRRVAQASHDEAQAAAQRLAEVAAPTQLLELAGSITRSAEAQAAAMQQFDQAELAAAAAEAVLAEFEPSLSLATRLGLHEELAKQVQLRQRGTGAVEAAAGDEAAAALVCTAAGATAQEAARVLEVARQQSLAAAVAAEVKAGDPCPVCGRLVADLPDHHGGDVVVAQRAAQESLRDKQHADAVARTAQDELLRIEEKLAAVRRRVEELTDQLPPRESLATVKTQLGAAKAAEEDVAAGGRTLTEARKVLRKAEEGRRNTEKIEREARVGLDGLRDALAPFGPPALSRADLLADWSLLVHWASERRIESEVAVGTARATMAEYDRVAAGLLEGLEESARNLGVRSGTDRLRDRVVAAHTTRVQEREQVARDLARSAELADELARLSETEQVASSLARHLQSNGFQKWLLDEALTRLVTGASATLFQLSSGAYSLGLDRKTATFTVVDHRNADAIRSVRTLSGGETFLASLALALSLADQVVDLAAGGATRLEAIFLDEGFGTLDPETLDVVAAAIEELGSQGRVVGVVSHVRELAERLPVRFEVVKEPNGSTVTRREG